MVKDVRLSSFPSNRAQALTMLYLENQNLSDKTPEQIVELYLVTNKQINERLMSSNNR